MGRPGWLSRRGPHSLGQNRVSPGAVVLAFRACCPRSRLKQKRHLLGLLLARCRCRLASSSLLSFKSHRSGQELPPCQRLMKNWAFRRSDGCVGLRRSDTTTRTMRWWPGRGVRVRVCVRVCARVHMCVHVCVCTRVCVPVRVCTRVCVRAHCYPKAAAVRVSLLGEPEGRTQWRRRRVSPQQCRPVSPARGSERAGLTAGGVPGFVGALLTPPTEEISRSATRGIPYPPLRQREPLCPF